MYGALTVSIRIIGDGVNEDFANCVAIAQIVMEALMPEQFAEGSSHKAGSNCRSANLPRSSRNGCDSDRCLRLRQGGHERDRAREPRQTAFAILVL